MGSLHSTLTQMFPPKPSFVEKDLPDLTGKVYIVSGSNTGVGKELARMLYSRNAKVYIAARSEERCIKAMEDIAVAAPNSKGSTEFLKLDLADLTTIKATVDEVLSKEKKLHVLFNNAGLMSDNPGKTKQDYETHIGINCLGTFLFTKLLTPILAETAKTEPAGTVRVVWVSSSGTELAGEKHVGIHLNNLDYHDPKPPMYKYAISKTGNYLHGVEYAKRHRSAGIVSVPLNPGNLSSELLRDKSLLFRMAVNPMTYAPVNGAYTELFAGLSPELTIENTGSWVIPFGRIYPIRPDLVAATKTEAEGGNGTASKFYDWADEQVNKYISGASNPFEDWFTGIQSSQNPYERRQIPRLGTRAYQVKVDQSSPGLHSDPSSGISGFHIGAGLRQPHLPNYPKQARMAPPHLRPRIMALAHRHWLPPSSLARCCRCASGWTDDPWHHELSTLAEDHPPFHFLTMARKRHLTLTVALVLLAFFSLSYFFSGPSAVGSIIDNVAREQPLKQTTEGTRSEFVVDLNAIPKGLLEGEAVAPKMENATLKAELGRATWKFLHTMMARFPEEPTKDERQTLETFIHLFARLYPCGQCAEHFQKLLVQYPPQTSSRNAAAGWMCFAHNIVNERVHKPAFDCNKIGDFYDCGCGDDKKKKKGDDEIVPEKSKD
ncbi:hypothetical protein G7046_g8034 [Stylonectria norvegica]|nr:hypothetical protein G7046_g8034 [Stylonectria norvegica]